MRSRPRKAGGSSPMLKGIVLAILLLVLLVFYQRVVQTGVPSEFGEFFDSSVESGKYLEQFERPVRDAYKKKYAGFWHREEMISDSIRVKDRLELKDNGIIWQVLEYDLSLPSGDSAYFAHVRHAYLDPYGLDTRDSSDVYAESHIIGQVYLWARDTCYGPSGLNAIWKAYRNQDSLELHGNQYVTYRSTSLDTFFPQGYIGHIDDFEVSKCPEGTDLGSFSRSKLIADIEQTKLTAKDASEIRSLIDAYYAPLFLNPIIENYRLWDVDIPSQITLRLSVSLGGTVTEVSVQGRTVTGRKAENSVASEAGTWSFPAPGRELEVDYIYKPPAAR